METRGHDTLTHASVIFVAVKVTNEKYCKNEVYEIGLPRLVILYLCLSNYMKVMILQYHTWNTICMCFSVHTYQNTICH